MNRRVNKTRVRTKLWRLEVMISVLKYLLNEDDATVSELKCYIHLPPDVVNRKLTRRLNSQRAPYSREGAKSDTLAQILFQMTMQGYLQKEKLGNKNLYRKTSLTKQALQTYAEILESYQPKEGNNHE